MNYFRGEDVTITSAVMSANKTSKRARIFHRNFGLYLDQKEVLL